MEWYPIFAEEETRCSFLGVGVAKSLRVGVNVCEDQKIVFQARWNPTVQPFLQEIVERDDERA